MARFEEVGKNGGVDATNQYMVVSLGGVNIVAFNGPKDFKIPPPKNLEISEITHKTYANALHKMQDQFAKWKLEGSDAAVTYIKSMHGKPPSNLRLLLVKGTHRGETEINAVSSNGQRARLRVSVVGARRKQLSVAFRFVEVHNSKKQTQQTKLDIYKKRDLLNTLNWTFGPQANVFFTLADAAPISVDVKDVPLDAPLTGQAFVNYVLPNKNTTASLTVFFVERYTSSDKDGFSENFPGQKACVVIDNPPSVITEGVPFDVTFAHEVCHFLQNDQQPSEVSTESGHHDREGILMSNGKESAKIDEQLMRRINVP